MEVQKRHAPRGTLYMAWLVQWKCTSTCSKGGGTVLYWFCIAFLLSTIVYTVNKFFAGATFVVVFAAIVIVVVVAVAAAAVVVVLLLWGC